MANKVVLLCLLLTLGLGLLVQQGKEPESEYLSNDAELRRWEQGGRYLTLANYRADSRGGEALKVYVQEASFPEASSEETLLLVHGFPTSSHDFAEVIKLFGRRFRRVVTWDHLGFGLSDKPRGSEFAYSIGEHADVALEVFKQLKVKEAHFVAHDMGDTIVSELAARQQLGLLPAWFNGAQSLTFTNGGMRVELANLRISQILLRIPIVGDVVTTLSSYWMFAKQIQSISGSPTALSTAQLTTMFESIEHKNGRYRLPTSISYVSERVRFQNQRWVPALKALRQAGVPIAFCWGEADAVAPMAIFERLKLDLPDAKFLSLSGLGHFTMLEDGQRWTDAILALMPHSTGKV